MMGTLFGWPIMSSIRHSHLAFSTMSPLFRNRARQPSAHSQAKRKSPMTSHFVPFPDRGRVYSAHPSEVTLDATLSTPTSF
ncbi:hypothetical protein BR93DRAFT_94707 [Coniochaeta sp. PMI_546]|nr:hypothetical protein BR93DRAFT_94707 [Coniochaeta sp. PMI_546]